MLKGKNCINGVLREKQEAEKRIQRNGIKVFRGFHHIGKGYMQKLRGMEWRIC